MGNIKTKQELQKFLEKVDSEQDVGPFTLRDSGIAEELHKKLETNALRYDNEPVTACPHCNSLYLIDNDVTGKLECYNCGHEIEEKDVVIFKSIHDYLDESSKDSDDA